MLGENISIIFPGKKKGKIILLQEKKTLFLVYFPEFREESVHFNVRTLGHHTPVTNNTQALNSPFTVSSRMQFFSC